MPDFDATEHEFLHAVGPLPNCPRPDLLLVCNQGVLPADVERHVQEHIQNCAICKMLRNDLTFLLTTQEQPDLAAKQHRRVRASIPGLASHSRLKWTALAAIAAAAILATVLLLHLRPHSPATPSAATSAAPSPSLPLSVSVIKLEPPEGILSGTETRSVLLAGRPASSELAPAFTAYQQNKYREAETDFSALSERYPESDVVFLYLGICQLFLDEDENALATLGRAEALAAPAREDAATWYHAVAALRLQDADSKHLFDQQCARRGSQYSSQACAVVKLLEANPPSLP